MEATEGVYDFSVLDDQIAAAHASGKKIGFALSMCSSHPLWLETVYHVPTFTVTHLSTTAVTIEPWNPIAEPKIASFVAAFCKHFDGKLDYLVMDGQGMFTESFIIDPTITGEDPAVSLANWTAYIPREISYYMNNMRYTRVIFAIAPPLSGPDAMNALVTVSNNAMAAYPNSNFGFANYGLNANSSTSFPPDNIIRTAATAGLCVGFQMLAQWAQDGTLAQTYDAAIALGAWYVETFSGVFNDPANASTISAASAALKANAH